MRRPRTMTLVELLVAVALGMLLIGVIAFVFQQSARIQDRISTETRAAFMVRAGMERLATDLHGIQYPWELGSSFRVMARDGERGPEDLLEYLTLEQPSRTPINVRVERDPVTQSLTRTVLRRWDVVNGGWVESNEQTFLAAEISSFQVEYSWVVDGNVTFLRGAPEGSSLTPDDGSLFIFQGAGNIDFDGALHLDEPWDGDNPLPTTVRTLHIFHPDAGGAYPLLTIESPTILRLSQAPAALGVQVTAPLLPPALRVTIQHPVGPDETRSLQRVLPVSH